MVARNIRYPGHTYVETYVRGRRYTANVHSCVEIELEFIGHFYSDGRFQLSKRKSIKVIRIYNTLSGRDFHDSSYRHVVLR